MPCCKLLSPQRCFFYKAVQTFLAKCILVLQIIKKAPPATADMSIVFPSEFLWGGEGPLLTMAGLEGLNLVPPWVEILAAGSWVDTVTEYSSIRCF